MSHIFLDDLSQDDLRSRVIFERIVSIQFRPVSEIKFSKFDFDKKRKFFEKFQISKFSKINFVTNWHKLIAPVTTIIYSHLCFNATSQKWVFFSKNEVR